jgi:hypothetical protein
MYNMNVESMKEINMRKYLIAAALVAMTVTSASAEVVCRPFYRSIWDVGSNQYVTVRGPDQCFENGPTYYYPEAAPRYYEPGPEPYYNDNGGLEFFTGALIGGLTGYAIGNYNDNNNNKNNYYYYNGNRNGHYKRQHHRRHEYREQRREKRRHKNNY